MGIVGYTGFKNNHLDTGGGFFMWSGSVASGDVTQDNYTGIGLEIHDGNTGVNESFFKFRTIDKTIISVQLLMLKHRDFF